MHLSRESIRSLRTSAVGILALVAVWWLAALTVLSGARVPTPDGVFTTAVQAGWGFWSLHFGMTLQEASVGFLYGTLAGLVVASLVLLFPVAEPVLMQVAVMSYCVPLVAIAPVLFIVIGNPDEGERSGTATALAALAVFFTTVVGTVLGLRSADRASLDVVRVFGGGRVRQLQKVQLISALPSILAAMRIGAPAAFLGAILGEYVGGVQRGVALILKIAQQNVDVEQAWAVGIGCALVAGAVYAVLGLVGRVVTPWSKGAAS
ncbi:ABC transporter permease [Modestobacter sp. VKM Ac-2984]|uniref:ABC transporter permease n=1 Tax=Modestobacter sp. VKM Ac-2984 TaxID=3004138 RepID=UPI0022AAC8A2|nr:ABC transporter permease subunit [Modestobacter sp. VKM Ac-2984]MCZ2818170.1 ABC transporter permease subunit [Modestobacter sp. VKM Ac-2984]